MQSCGLVQHGTICCSKTYNVACGFPCTLFWNAELVDWACSKGLKDLLPGMLLEESFADGRLLCRLVGLLERKALPGIEWRAPSAAASRHNVAKVLMSALVPTSVAQPRAQKCLWIWLTHLFADCRLWPSYSSDLPCHCRTCGELQILCQLSLDWCKPCSMILHEHTADSIYTLRCCLYCGCIVQNCICCYSSFAMIYMHGRQVVQRWLQCKCEVLTLSS